ncbi:MAG TPA: hypothetical protein VGR61_02355 [Candidatus Dormibacteraeota bacterium]|nr:hypothetical protein [Candidatus Dormibacteraeota bacterium]
MVSWIAVIQYLRASAIEETLQAVSVLPRRSRLVMTYVVPPTELTEMEQAGLAWTMSHAAARSEPFHTLLRPAEIDDLLQRHGFQTVEQLGPVELRHRYFPEQPDLRLPGIERIVVAAH